MTAVQDILRSLGITRCYKGFKHTEYAICLAIQDESRLEAITKEIYMETAAHFECNWTAVERNIRTAVSRAWSVAPAAGAASASWSAVIRCSFLLKHTAVFFSAGISPTAAVRANTGKSIHKS